MDDDRLLRAEEARRRSEWIKAIVNPRLGDLKDLVAQVWQDRNKGRKVVASITRCERGAFNACFFLTCKPEGESEAADKWVFRTPFPEAPLLDERFQADLATLCYIRNHAPSIPVPTLIASGTTSPFGTPYMILEELPGQLLGNRSIDWGALSEDTHRHVERQLATLLLELATLRFDRIGVLAADSVTGKIDVRERPMTVDMQSAARDGTDLDRAFSRDKTFASAAEFTSALIALHSRRFADQRSAFGSRAEDFGDPDYDLDAYFKAYIRREFAAVAEKFVQERFPSDGGPFCLRHGDFRYANVFVDPQTFDVTGIIDWEFCVAVPALYIQLPLRSKVDPREFVNPERFAEYWAERQRFIDILETVEFERHLEGDLVGGQRLSQLMRSVTPDDFWILQGIEDLYTLEHLYSDFIHPSRHDGEKEMVSSRRFRDELLQREKEEGGESELLALIRKKVADGEAFRLEVERLGVPPTPDDG